MRLNENIAISTPKVLLVPYDAHHVLRYHEWMRDPAIQEATASEPLTLDEEYENQQSWRTSHDKLTFIVCRPIGDLEHDNSVGKGGNSIIGDRVYAGEVDAPDHMVGDINLFLTPWEGDEGGDDGALENGVLDLKTKRKQSVHYCNAEVDIMIAERDHRGKGLGISAVSTLLRFIRRHLEFILDEYGKVQQGQSSGGAHCGTRFVLKDLVAKINASNAGSIALFTKLGFRQRGEVNYFGELEMVLEGFGTELSSKGAVGGESRDTYVTGYRELVYDRSRLMKQ